MAKPELGIKRTCGSCGARFYDLGRTEIVCPKCGTPWGEPTRSRPAPAPPPPPPPEEDLEMVEESESDDIDDDLMDADDGLEDDDEDDDDVGEVVPAVGDDEKETG